MAYVRNSLQNLLEFCYETDGYHPSIAEMPSIFCLLTIQKTMWYFIILWNMLTVYYYVKMAYRLRYMYFVFLWFYRMRLSNIKQHAAYFACIWMIAWSLLKDVSWAPVNYLIKVKTFAFNHFDNLSQVGNNEGCVYAYRDLAEQMLSNFSHRFKAVLVVIEMIKLSESWYLRGRILIIVGLRGLW